MAKKEKYQPRPDGRYYTSVGTGKYKDNGVPERIPVYAKSSEELEQKVIELRYQIRTGQYQIPTDITIAKYAVQWYCRYKDRKSINTKAMYTNAINKHIIPTIGGLKIKNLTAMDCQAMINDNWDHYETCNKIQLTMRQIQKKALLDRIITDPFWVDIDMPKKVVLKEKRPLTIYEKRAIQKADFTPKEKAFVYLLFGCGLRRCEAIALRKGDFDFRKKQLSVNYHIVFDKNTPVMIDGSKTDAGVRSVPIPSSVYNYIRDYVTTCDTIQIFTTRERGLVTKSSYDKMWASILKKMQSVSKRKIEGLTAHIFRHNYATVLYYSGISELKAIELMGHADSTMIREVYAHLDESKEKAASKLDKAIHF